MGTRVHFIGIGGSGMAPLARLAALADDPVYAITGTDPGIKGDTLGELETAGCKIWTRHDPGHLDGCDIVVYSTAIAADHPERARAAELAARGEVILEHRMDFLSRLVARCPVQLAVAGTHGKTSTASLLGWVLQELGADPDIIVGGRPAYLPAGVRRGAGVVAVYETDESDGSFLRARAAFRLCLNIDADHLEFYGDLAGLTAAFVEFARNGTVSVLNENDPPLRARLEEDGAANQVWFRAGGDPALTPPLAAAYAGRFVGASDRLVLAASASGSGEEVMIALPLPGRHFASNALGALGLLDRVARSGLVPALIGRGPADFAAAMNRFPGVERRMQLIGRIAGADVYDDYGHHPTEIRAVLAALRGRMAPGARLTAVFQPHRFSRTSALFAEFARALAEEADRIFFLPIYAAGESPREGVDAGLIARELSAHASVTLLAADEWAPVFAGCAPGEVVACLGAGDISASIRNFLKTSRPGSRV